MKTKFNHQKRITIEAGFTLIEVLIAMFIATVGLLALVIMQANAIRGNGFANQLTRATLLAQARLEQLNSTLLSPYEVSGTDLEAGAGGTEENIGPDGKAGGPFTLIWAVAPYTPFSRKVTVVVTWRDGISSAWARLQRVEFSSITRGIFYEQIE